MNHDKNGSSLNSCNPLSSLVSGLVVLFLQATILPLYAQQSYEALPVLSASKILPNQLLSREHFRVQEKVTNGCTLVIIAHQSHRSVRAAGTVGGRASQGPACVTCQ